MRVGDFIKWVDEDGGEDEYGFITKPQALFEGSWYAEFHKGMDHALNTGVKDDGSESWDYPEALTLIIPKEML